MKLIDDLQSLDTNDPGRWPLPFRIAAVVLVFAGVFNRVARDLNSIFTLFAVNVDTNLLPECNQLFNSRRPL